MGDESVMPLSSGEPTISSLEIAGGILTNTGILEFEIGGAVFYDQIGLTGTLQAAERSPAQLLVVGNTPADGDAFDLMDFGSLVNNGYTVDLSNANLPAGLSWDTAALSATRSISVVPEPSSLLLLVVGLAAQWASIAAPAGKTAGNGIVCMPRALTSASGDKSPHSKGPIIPTGGERRLQLLKCRKSSRHTPCAVRLSL